MASGGYSLVLVSGLLLAVASLVLEHGLWSMRASPGWLASSRAQTPEPVAHALGCSVAYGIFPDQGLNLSPVR